MMYSSTKNVLLAAVGYMNFAEIYVLSVNWLTLRTKAYGTYMNLYKSTNIALLERSGYIYSFHSFYYAWATNGYMLI